MESSGPDGKVRGTAQQVHDKYLALARDALSAGDRVAAETFAQFADHYYRIVQGSREDDQASGRNGANNRPQPEPETAEAAPAPARQGVPVAELREMEETAAVGNTQPEAADDTPPDPEQPTP